MRHKNIIQESLRFWLSQHPESGHPLDERRFYIFAKNVCRYSRKNKDGDWLRKEILKSGKNFSKEGIEKFCILFNKLQDFYNTKIPNKS